MRLSSRMAVHLFDGAEGVGISRAELVVPLGLDADRLVDPRNGIEWETLAAILERLALLLDGDVERLRCVGRQMVLAPSYVFLQRMARTLFSLRRLYEMGERWLAPANVPHLVLRTTFPAENRLHFHCSIPEPHAASAPYLHIFEGVLLELPTILGLPQATIAASHVTPRELDLVLDLPPSPGLVAQLERAGRAVFHWREALDLLEQQRRDMAHGLEAVQRSTQEIRTLFDRLPDLVAVHRAGNILWVNRATVTTLGYERGDDLVGRSLLDVVAPTSRALVTSFMFGERDGEERPDAIDAKLVTRRGDPVLVEVCPVRVVSFGGAPARLVVARDITERTRLQQQLLTADRMASIGMLAAGVAHEVNNPLAYVLNNVEIALKELTPLGESTRRSREVLAVALEGVDHIRTVVRDLLLLSRVDEVAIDAVDVRAIVDSTLSLAAVKVAERAELVREYEPVPLARGTPARIGQMVLNLVTNALEAMPAASRAKNQLRVAVRPSSTGGVVIEVSDNGCGIAPEHASRIFDPFFTTKPPGTGTGLGLAISQRLAAEVGGALSFESTPAAGSTFRVTLAAQDAG